MANIRIRLVCGIENEDILTELHQECFDGDSLPDFDQEYWWLAYDDKEPIAFAGMHKSRSWHNVGYMCRVGVLPEYRGNGLQKRLIRTRLAHAKRHGWVAVITDTYDNPPSSNSLISCGFKLYNPENPWSFKNALYWIKRLD